MKKLGLWSSVKGVKNAKIYKNPIYEAILWSDLKNGGAPLGLDLGQKFQIVVNPCAKIVSWIDVTQKFCYKTRPNVRIFTAWVLRECTVAVRNKHVFYSTQVCALSHMVNMFKDAFYGHKTISTKFGKSKMSKWQKPSSILLHTELMLFKLNGGTKGIEYFLCHSL